MCLRNLFGGNVNCTWLLFIIALILILDQCDSGCDNTPTYTGNGCGCGCGC